MDKRSGLHLPELESYKKNSSPEYTSLAGHLLSQEFGERAGEDKAENISRQWFADLFTKPLSEQDILALKNVYRQTSGIPAVKPVTEFEAWTRNQTDKAPLELLKEYYGTGMETSKQFEEWFYELGKFVEEKYRQLQDQEAKDRLAQFVIAIKDMLFESTNSPADGLTSDKLVLVASRLSRNPYLRATIGPELTKLLASRLQMPVGGVNTIAVKDVAIGLSKQPLVEVLDAVDTLKAVSQEGARLVFPDASAACLKIIKQLESEVPHSRLFSQACEIAQKEITTHYERFAENELYLLTEFDPQGARVYEELDKALLTDHERLKKQIKSNRPLQESEHYYRFSSDSVAILDYTSKVCDIGWYNQDQTESVDFNSLDQAVCDPKTNPFYKESGENAILLLRHLHHPKIREQVEQDFGIKLNNVSLGAQNELLKLLANPETNDFYIHLQQESRALDESTRHMLFEAFMACAENDGYSQSILELVRTQERSNLVSILEKFNEIVVESRRIERFLLHEFGDKETYDIEMIKAATRDLQHEANELIVTHSNSTETDISKKLEDIRVQSLLAGVAFQHIAEYKGLSPIELGKLLKEMKSYRILSRSPKDLDEPTRKRIVEVLLQNRLGEYEPSQLTAREQEIRKAVEPMSNSEFVLLYFDPENKPINELEPTKLDGFMRFDSVADKPNELYAASLNVPPELRKRKVGTALLTAALRERAQYFHITAAVYEKKINLINHYENLGFKVTSMQDNFHNTGKRYALLKWAG